MPRKRPLVSRRKPSQERSQVTVGAILEAAAQVLLDFGFTKTSTNKIAKRAGVSIGTYYQYFPNKESLVAALIERELQTQTQRIQAVFADMQGQPLDALLRALVEGFLSLYFDRRLYLGALMENATRLAQHKALIASRRQVAEGLQRALSLPDAKIFVCLHAVLGVAQGLRLEENLSFSREELGREMLALLSQYLSQPR